MNVNQHPSDLEILWVEPQSNTDERVPTAQELAGANHLHQQNLGRAQSIERPAGLRNRPQFSVSGKGVILPTGLSPYAPGHPAIAPLQSNVAVTLPSLGSVDSSISRYDYLYLAVMGVEVTAEIDPAIALEFSWRNQSNAIQTLTKENTRRIRSVWMVVHSIGGPITTAILLSSLTTVPSGNTQIVASKNAAGVPAGTLRYYPLDPNLATDQVYVVRQDTVELISLCRVWRVQNFTQSGYHWGRGGEKDFELNFHVQPAYRYVGEGWDNWESRSRETFRRVLLGLPLMDSPTLDRLVSNLINGQVGTNLDAPGIATASPNGSTALANGQRVSFTNQGITQQTYCLPVITSNSAGVAQGSVPFQTNSPAGAFFSQNAADHKVYNSSGREVTGEGILTGLGGTGALIWTASNSAVVTPGDVIYFVPGIVYPAGSGFANGGEREAAYLNTTALNSANVREASINDIDSYTAPVGGEAFIVVLGKERAALHYIYKRLTVASNSSGVLAIPNNERGCIAFIEGIAGRIDRPIVSGLTPSTNYNLLIYYPPSPTENWQIQTIVSRYAGTGERTWLNGSTIATTPIGFAHTQGGGNGVFLADGELQYEAIAFRLPENTLAGAVKAFLCNHRIQFAYENSDLGATSCRDISLMPASGLVLPRVGMTINVINASNSQGKGIAARLQAPSGQAYGILKLPIQCSQIYQVVISFIVAVGGVRRLLVVTLNGGDPAVPSLCSFDTDNLAAIDTFQLF